jgi:hypothetical protein
MTTCEIHWRPSGGRGEFEFVPAESLKDRDIHVDFDQFGVRFDAEVSGRLAQGKPRLRKRDSNNRNKLHLPQLVMAVAALPEPARSDVHELSFPLENKAFVIDQMDFDIIEDDGITVVLSPLRVSVLHSDFQVQLDDRLCAIARDFSNINLIRSTNPELADAVKAHKIEISKGVNSSELRRTADRLIYLKSNFFGQTNSGSVSSLLNAQNKSEVEAEDISGVEGRLLTRIHVYKERDRGLVKRAKDYYRSISGGKIICEACGVSPVDIYGEVGESSIEAHHKTPIEELQPDSETKTADLAMVCAGCHRVIHSKKPCLTTEEVKDLILSNKV